MSNPLTISAKVKQNEPHAGEDKRSLCCPKIHRKCLAAPHWFAGPFSRFHKLLSLLRPVAWVRHSESRAGKFTATWIEFLVWFLYDSAKNMCLTGTLRICKLNLSPFVFFPANQLCHCRYDTDGEFLPARPTVVEPKEPNFGFDWASYSLEAVAGAVAGLGLHFGGTQNGCRCELRCTFWNLWHPSKKDMLDVSHRYHRRHRRCGGIIGTWCVKLKEVWGENVKHLLCKAVECEVFLCLLRHEISNFIP